jgi:hypothetical protein
MFLLDFCIFVFCRSIREEWQISCGNAWKFRSPGKSIDRAQKSIDRILPKLIDRIYPELTFAETLQNAQSRAFPWQKATLLLIFGAELADLLNLVVSSLRGTLENGRDVFFAWDPTLILFYKAIAMPPCWIRISESS